MSGMNANARTIIFSAVGRAIAPRIPMRVSEWAEKNRILSGKGSQMAGQWRNDRNPLQIEIMDCQSARSPVHEAVALLPIQFGKSEIETNILAYAMCEDPGPTMVVLPGEVSMNKWIDQKLNPLIDSCPAVQRVLTSLASRESSNRRAFKDFEGGQLYIEHAGNPTRLKSTSVKRMLVDEFSSFASALKTGDDPDAMLDGRNSAFPSTYKRLKVGTPDTIGTCRLTALWEKSDQRLFHVACPDCDAKQPLEWSGLQWTPEASRCWYACRECGVVIEEYQKSAMIAQAHARQQAGELGIGWVPTHPERKIRGYRANCLYYPLGLGPRWLDLVHMWLEAQGDPAKLKTFVNDRLAEAWEDPAMRAVKQNLVAERAEARALRPVPHWVMVVTVGVDTQDNRLAVHRIGWGRAPKGGLRCWTIDYVELPGDPANDEVWVALTELLNEPIDREDGAMLRVDASAQDMLGHRTEAVKAYVRDRRGGRRHMAIFGAKSSNAPAIGKGKLQDINWRGVYDKRGVMVYQVGTVTIKNMLYAWLGADEDRELDDRRMRFSDQLSLEYFGGLTSETFDPRKNRYVAKRGSPRNEPLDTWVYAYAATLHPELRLPQWTRAQWDARAAQLLASIGKHAVDSRETPRTPDRGPTARDSRETPQDEDAFGSGRWSSRL